MRYIKFNIKNYKGIPNIQLDLKKKPQSNIFTLVGLNESGKTSILEAINFFEKGIARTKAHTLIPKSRQYNFTGATSVEAEIELDDCIVQEIEDYLKNEHGFTLTEDIGIIKIRRECRFNNSTPSENQWNEEIWSTHFIGKPSRAKNEKSLLTWNGEVWKKTIGLIQREYIPKILYYPNFLFEFPERIYLEPAEDESREQEEYRSVIQDILNSIEEGLTVKDSLLDRAKNKGISSYKDALDQLLLKMSYKLNAEILQSWDAIFEGAQEKRINISCNSEVEDPDNPRYFIELKIEQGSDSYSINDRSLGFRWFFSFLIFTAFRKSRSSDPGETLFLLDEPASNLHQSSQQKLLLSLDQIVSDCKLIYSTHSHHLIDPKWLAGTYIVRNQAMNYDNPEEAHVTETNINAILYKNFVAQCPKEDNHFQPILDALDYMPSKLEMVPSIVFTEGKNDYYIFKYIGEILFQGECPLNFYPGAGADKYEDVFRLYLAWNKNFVALFDADKKGEAARKRYVRKIGADVENRIFTLKNVAEAWAYKETEDLLSSDAEKSKIIRTCFEDSEIIGGYEKSKFNTAIQNLYINKTVFKFNKPTLERFRKIFEFLEAKLNDLENL